MASKLEDMATWTDLIGHAQLRSFVDDEGHFGLSKTSLKRRSGRSAKNMISRGSSLVAVAHTLAACSSMAKFVRRPQRPRSSYRPAKIIRHASEQSLEQFSPARLRSVINQRQLRSPRLDWPTKTRSNIDYVMAVLSTQTRFNIYLKADGHRLSQTCRRAVRCPRA
jgi:hypothetical protein